MVGKVSQFTLQPVANTNHKFPATARATGAPCDMKFINCTRKSQSTLTESGFARCTRSDIKSSCIYKYRKCLVIIMMGTTQGRNYHEASEAVASSLKSRSSVLSTDTILASISRSHLLFHMTAGPLLAS